MEILFILIPISLILVAVGIGIFIWAVRHDQFDDLDGPAHSILYDDDEDLVPPEARVNHDTDPRTKDRSENPDP